MKKELYLDLFKDIVGEKNCHIDEPMNRHTSFKVGGPADIMILPRSAEDLVAVVKVCKEREIPLFIMGNGTNLVVRDKGIRGAVVKLCGSFENYKVEDEFIEAEAGVLLSRLSRTALEHGLSGLEFAEGIPGTLGGAVAMNAGAYGSEMKDVVVETRCLDSNGNIEVIRGDGHRFSYRSSVIQKEGKIVIASKIKLNRGRHGEIKALMEEFRRRRRERQPLDLPSAGSVFKRPQGFYTGKLIEECGLKGYSIGGAQVSAKHCGFIVNTGGATSEDIIKLIRCIQDKVRERFGVNLETEVRIVGEE